MPSNYQLKVNTNQLTLPSVHQHQTIHQIPSTFTIQPLHLNFPPLIIPPSLKYTHPKIIFHKTHTPNKKPTQTTTLKHPSKHYFSQILFNNQLNLLLTPPLN
ncbi:DNA/RNA helicase domain-containing protein, partial [Staphylococcus epidermidis]|uniref:DNA/RNA helicase domain-containing protein n=1 Tax=Staphylococcus epidermidis TaxID=1282 RepID=UPI0034D973F7